jgi:hypothetical protein
VSHLLIGRQFQAGLDLRSLHNLIVFATHDRGQPCQIGEDGSRAILRPDGQDGTRFGVVVNLEVALNGRHRPTQFCSVFAVAGIAKRG